MKMYKHIQKFPSYDFQEIRKSYLSLAEAVYSREETRSLKTPSGSGFGRQAGLEVESINKYASFMFHGNHIKLVS